MWEITFSYVERSVPHASHVVRVSFTDVLQRPTAKWGSGWRQAFGSRHPLEKSNKTCHILQHHCMYLTFKFRNIYQYLCKQLSELKFRGKSLLQYDILFLILLNSNCNKTTHKYLHAGQTFRINLKVQILGKLYVRVMPMSHWICRNMCIRGSQHVHHSSVDTIIQQWKITWHSQWRASVMLWSKW